MDEEPLPCLAWRRPDRCDGGLVDTTSRDVNAEESPKVECVQLPLRLLRCDGETQSRQQLNLDVVQQYAELMLGGVDLPPVRACFDGTSYWLTDGFHRVAAAEQVGLEKIYVELFRGSLSDARWDSYRANAIHGLRRTPDDVKVVIRRALIHERAIDLSNRELARHLHVSEKTIRRFRESTSAAGAADVRLAFRNGGEYKIHTANIGKGRKDSQVLIGKNSHTALDRRLAAELLVMEREASPDVRRLLIIFKNWTQRTPHPSMTLQALESVVAELKRSRIPG